MTKETTDVGNSERNELRSYLVAQNDEQLPSTTSPCEAPNGFDWIHAYPSGAQPATPYTGKWLIRVGCVPARYCWQQVRGATEMGQLGIGSKISTHSHMADDPAARWKDHAICVFTADFRDQSDVLRVAMALKTIDAVRKSVLHYKADATTFGGRYKGNASGEIAIYSCPPPYDQLSVDDANVRLAIDEASR